MLPFVFSLALPLLAGVNPPTWSLREVDEFPDLRTLKAAVSAVRLCNRNKNFSAGRAVLQARASPVLGVVRGSARS